MKPLDPHSIRQRAATLFSAAPMSLIVIALPGIAALVVIASAFCTIPFSRLLNLAASFAQAGIVISLAAGLWSAAHKKTLQNRVPRIRIRRRD